MIAKIVTGKSFGGAVRYLTQKSGHARMLDSDGIDTRSIKDMIGSFNFQRKARPEKAQVVGHISLSFHKNDVPKLTDEFMTDLAHEYMQRMGITDTQYMIVRHTDTEHPHLHILYNRVRYDAKLVRSHNERIRSTTICKAMKQKHGLTFSEGKANVKAEKLHRPDKVKYAVYEAVKAILPDCLSLPELAERLQDKGIETTFIHRGNDPAKEIQGVTFTKDNLTFKASQVDRKFSYANLWKTIERNRFIANTAARVTEQAERERQKTEHQQQTQAVPMSTPEPRTEIRGMKLTPEQQRRLYSPQGLKCSYGENGYRNTSRFRVNRTSGQDILTEELLSQEKINRNPRIFGIRLTDEQVREIKDGQPVYIKGMQYEGETFDGYLVMDDKLTRGKAYVKQDPCEWVKYGKYTMRRMDRDLIKGGFVVRALVQWWGGHGQTARPYLWKENPSDETYKEDWSDPREPKPERSRKEELHVPSIPPKKKSQGPKM
ncbi:relaxase/mobilization nuclease domain-containing protein [Gabonibacter chumensis]|uniref:relaxase/mobilization nuclease domain-containing protein n=1 Tax=Gabonibacter chumensis TaxID=2972474 RepID=UPI0025740F42|nr:relaxase/mobilization nuclease domain-containing protein [Gabonibacter chumensis]MCR9012655.1 relaxase/mobilization nuclease domain-containing protein [Gabonibacter chumensis]